MAQLIIKTESRPTRCEICHNVDQFDTETGLCQRCASAVPEKAQRQLLVPTNVFERLILANRSSQNKSNINLLYSPFAFLVLGFSHFFLFAFICMFFGFKEEIIENGGTILLVSLLHAIVSLLILWLSKYIEGLTRRSNLINKLCLLLAVIDGITIAIFGDWVQPHMVYNYTWPVYGIFLCIFGIYSTRRGKTEK